MSIGQFSLLEETQKRNLVSRLRLPVSKRTFIKFNSEVNELFNAKEVNKIIEKQFNKAYYENKILLIQAILTISDYETEAIAEYYKETYNKKFEGDYKLILAELKKYIRVVKEPIKTGLQEQNFEALISGIESITGPIPRDMKLYQFKHKIEYAAAYVKAQEENNINLNG